jgi:hypothetical protein
MRVIGLMATPKRIGVHMGNQRRTCVGESSRLLREDNSSVSCWT